MSWTAQEVAKALCPGGKGKSRKKAASWMALCPCHTDERPSLHLTDGRKGLVWYCHAGCQQDVVGKAIRELMKGSAPITGARRETTSSRRAIVYTPHVPSEMEWGRIMNQDFIHYLLGAPSRVWTYRSAAGAPLMYVARYEANHGKEILPYSWQSMDGQPPKFEIKAWSDARPLYNLDQLTARPDAPVIYVEGEKAADAAIKLFPSFVVTTHQGGGKALGKADLSSLKGRLVIIQPDADEAGQWMVENLTLALAGIARRVLAFDWPDVWPDGSPYEVVDGGDAHDHLQNGWTRDMIAAMHADGSLKLVEPDICRKFGEGDVGPLWGCVTIVEETAMLMLGDDVLAMASAPAWRAVCGDAESEFNRRLERNHAPTGRFPRRSSTAAIAPFMVGEVYDLFRRLTIWDRDVEMAITGWLKCSVFNRGNPWRDVLAARKLDMRRAPVA